MGENGTIRLSSAVYELTLVVAPKRSHESFTMLKDSLREGFWKGNRRLQKRYETIIKNHWSIKRKSLCPYAESMDETEMELMPRQRSFCPPLEEGDVMSHLAEGERTCGRCPLHYDLLDAFKEAAMTQSGREIVARGPEVALTFGTYDLATLWPAPDHIAAAYTRNEFRQIGEDLDFVSIPATRIRGDNPDDGVHAPDEYASYVAFDHYSSRVCAYVFVQPANWDREGYASLKPLVRKFLELRKRSEYKHNRLEAFLTYAASFPMFVKVEARDDEDAMRVLNAIYGLAQDPTADTWTLYGLITPAENGKLLYPSPPRLPLRASSGTGTEAPLRFLVFVNVRCHGPSREKLAQEIATTLSRYELKAPNPQPTAAATGPPLPRTTDGDNNAHLLVGHYDYVFTVEVSEAAAVARCVVEGLRALNLDEIDRIVAIPMLQLSPRRPGS